MNGTQVALLNAEVGEDLGLGFVDGQQVVAGGAVLRDAGCRPWPRGRRRGSGSSPG